MQPPVGGGYPPSTPAAAPKPADPARSAAIMLVIAAVLILIGTVSKNWVSGGRGSRDIHIGPMGGEACMSGACVDIPTRGIDGDIEAIMVLALISGFASAAAAGTFGGMALAGKTDKIPLPPRLAQMAFGLAAFSMTFFVIRMISEKGELSWAGFPAIGGVILAGVGLKKLTPFLAAKPSVPPGAQQQFANQQPYGNQSQPMQPYGQQSQPMQPYANQSQPMAAPQQPPPGAAPIHNCPRCGTQLHWVAQYQRWFCPREQQYV
ncbi:MAG TPA: hypothetical protein VFV99_30740 [Kofleriaceae bacterium]|nr:hypothetical protein [Kofleriaceae bacterium]